MNQQRLHPTYSALKKNEQRLVDLKIALDWTGRQVPKEYELSEVRDNYAIDIASLKTMEEELEKKAKEISINPKQPTDSFPMVFRLQAAGIEKSQNLRS